VSRSCSSTPGKHPGRNIRFDQTSDQSTEGRWVARIQHGITLPARAFCAIRAISSSTVLADVSFMSANSSITTTITGRFPVPAVCSSIDSRRNSAIGQAACRPYSASLTLRLKPRQFATPHGATMSL